MPVSAPVAVMTCRTASKIRSGRSLAASRLRHAVNAVGWNPGPVGRVPARGLPAQVERERLDRLDRLTVGMPVQYKDCSTSTEVMTSGGIEGRPRPEGNRSANISGGNNRSRCSAGNANTPGHQQMPRQRLHVQQLPLPISLTLHETRIATMPSARATR